MTALETWLLIVALVALPGLVGYIIGGYESTLPADADEDDLR